MSLPPPSYTTEDRPQHNTQSPSVTRRKSSKEKEKEREAAGFGESSAEPLLRRKSRRHSSHAADAPKFPQEIINRIARQSVRSSRHIDAELLKQIAKDGGLPKDLEVDSLPKFKVITGSEATKVYEKTLREDDRASALSHESSKRRGNYRHFEQRPIVFAYPGIRAGRKVVDYYMTWKGKTPKAHRLKGAGRRPDILDGEFKSLTKTLDDYGKKVKRLSNLISPISEPTTPKASTSTHPVPTNADVQTAVEPTRPTAIQVESAPAIMTTTALADNDPLPPPPRAPYARTNSNGSAVSLPYLGDRLPLVVVNPDASSSSGQDSRRSSLIVNTSRKPTKDKSPLQQVLTAVEEEREDAQSTSSQKESCRDKDSDSNHHHHKRGGHEHKHKHNRDSSNSPTSSTDSLSGSSSGHEHRKSNEDEILIVLLDDKKSPWHGLAGRRDSKTSSPASVTRKTSQRSSPWSGPVANSRGEIHRFVPGGVPSLDIYDPEFDYEGDDSDKTDTEEDDGLGFGPAQGYDLDDNLILSLKARLTALGLHTPASSPRPTPLPQNSLLPSVLSPYQNSTNSPYLHQSPSGHVSLHQSPYSISAPNLPLPESSPASSYVIPFVSDAALGGPSVYNSPYASPAQIQSPYLNRSTGGVYNNTPVPSIYTGSPYMNMSNGSGGGVPLPAVSGYSMSPYMDYNMDYVEPALYSPSAYSSSYVPLRTQSPTPY